MTIAQTKATRPLCPTQIMAGKTSISHGGLHRQTRIKLEAAKEQEPERQSDVCADSDLLDWARMRIAQIHQSSVGIERHRLDLMARGESDERLHQLKMWRESSCFSEKEKVVLTLVEAISLGSTKPVLSQILERTRCHFKSEELISLLLAIMAVNDWYFHVHSGGTEKALPSRPTETFHEQSICPHWQRIAHRLTSKVFLIPQEA